METLRKLICVPSVSGRESGVRRVIQNMICDRADSITVDALGNLIAFKKGNGASQKKLMIAAHIDEIGLMVTCVTEQGYLRCAPIGAVNYAASAYGHVLCENGTHGLLVPQNGTKPEDYKADRFVIDIGARSRREAEKKVSVGDTFILEPALHRLCGGRYAGHAMDDKISAAALIGAFLRARDFPNDTYVTFTVQEEVGCRGSRTAAFAIAPDWGVAVDVTPAQDEYGQKDTAVRLGGGAAVKLKDASVICSPCVVQKLHEIADLYGIVCQDEILEKGGTDTSSMQMAGCGAFAGCVSVPTRYTHTGIETFDIKDYRAATALLRALMETPL